MKKELFEFSLIPESHKTIEIDLDNAETEQLKLSIYNSDLEYPSQWALLTKTEAGKLGKKLLEFAEWINDLSDADLTTKISPVEQMIILNLAAQIISKNTRKADVIAKYLPSYELAEVLKRFQSELDKAT